MSANFKRRISRTSTSFSKISLDSEKLLASKDCGLILLLFHIQNDLSLNSAFHQELRRHRQGSKSEWAFGIELSHMRTMCSQSREALHVLPKIRQSEYLMSLLSTEANKAFEYLDNFHPKGLHKSDFLRFKKIRDVMTFHYDTCELPRWYRDALDKRNLDEQGSHLLVPAPNQPFSLRFSFIDEINARIIRTKILEQPLEQRNIDEALRLTSGVVDKVSTILDCILTRVVADFRL